MWREAKAESGGDNGGGAQVPQENEEHQRDEHRAFGEILENGVKRRGDSQVRS